MAQLKDLLVTGPVRLLSDVVLGHDPTAALHAATKQYVDASAGKLTVGALTSGTTYYPILATGTGTATRQIDSSLPGFTYVKTNGTTGVEGTAVLSLGNTTASGTAGNASGRLALYDYSGKKATILPRAVTSHTVDTALYLPDWGTSASTYLVATTTTNAVGSSTVSVYVDSKGVIQQGNTYAGGTQITLNGTSKASSTASFYAPTSSGSSGQVLQSSGSGAAPNWVQMTSGPDRVFRGTCSTAASTAAKVVVCSNYDVLMTGDIIFVKFTNAGSVNTTNWTLNINNTGATSIRKQSGTNLTTVSELYVKANSTYRFVYDGTYWIMDVSEAGLPSGGDTYKVLSYESGTGPVWTSVANAVASETTSEIDLWEGFGTADDWQVYSSYSGPTNPSRISVHCQLQPNEQYWEEESEIDLYYDSDWDQWKYTGQSSYIYDLAIYFVGNMLYYQFNIDTTVYDTTVNLIISHNVLSVDNNFVTLVSNSQTVAKTKAHYFAADSLFTDLKTAISAEDGPVFFEYHNKYFLYHQLGYSDGYIFFQAYSSGQSEQGLSYLTVTPADPYNLTTSTCSTQLSNYTFVTSSQIPTSMGQIKAADSGSLLRVTSQIYRYRLVLTSENGQNFVPINGSNSTSTSASKNITTTPIDPCGPIYFYNTPSYTSSNGTMSAKDLFLQGEVDIRYSFLTSFTTYKPVYLKCGANASNSIVINSSTPFVQTISATDDGSLYILLGYATASYTLKLISQHPIYYYSATEGRVVPFKSGGGAGLKCYKIELPVIGEDMDGTFQITIKPIVTYTVRSYNTEFYYFLMRQESCTFKFETHDQDCYAYYWDGMEWSPNVVDSFHEYYVSEYSVHDVTGMTQAQAESYLTVESVTL